MSKIEDKTLIKLEAFVKNDFIDCKDEISLLIKEYKKKSNRLTTIIKQSDSQHKELLNLNDELDSYKNHLEKKVKEEIQKRQHQDRILLQQSKLAAMGEMIDAIAQQWKQPLNIIDEKVNALYTTYDLNPNIEQNEINEFSDSIYKQVEDMVNTLDEFRSFLRLDKEVQSIEMEKVVINAICLIQDEILKENISISINPYEPMQLQGIENEFQHIILNLLNNSKDAFIDNNIKHREISIDIFKDHLEVIDNAGGIPEHCINDIFKTGFTTKKNGTGIGLYMSQFIAHKSHLNIQAENIKNGAKFTIKHISTDA